jgi:Smg protein
MKESVLDVLMYLFEHYLDDDEVDVDSDRESLNLELVDAGFPEAEIHKAFTWLEGLTNDDELLSEARVGTASMRVYSHEETGRLDAECRGFLMFLEQVGVLEMHTRELVIDRVMALGNELIDLEQLKWVVLMVLFNQPGKESMFSWMEDFVFDGQPGLLH